MHFIIENNLIQYPPPPPNKQSIVKNFQHSCQPGFAENEKSFVRGKMKIPLVTNSNVCELKQTGRNVWNQVQNAKEDARNSAPHICKSAETDAELNRNQRNLIVRSDFENKGFPYWERNSMKTIVTVGGRKWTWRAAHVTYTLSRHQVKQHSRTVVRLKILPKVVSQ